jgi:hypothetical protein
VLIVATVGSYNDYKKEEQFLKLAAIGAKDNVVSIFTKILRQLNLGNGFKKRGRRSHPP